MLLSPLSVPLMILNGEWSFTLDPEDCGETECWFSRTAAHTIQVPGSWEEQGFGRAPTSNLLSGWTKQTEYEGAAWYIREIHIPEEWKGKSITLTLKGVRWRSRVWVSGEYVGQRESLSIPHRYDLTSCVIPGGSHRLAIRVDNRMIFPLQESHINSLQTATHWGGITGGIELAAKSSISIQRVICQPNVSARRFELNIAVNHGDGLILEASISNPDTGGVQASVPVQNGQALLTVELGQNARLWWDDDPFLYFAEFRLRRGAEVIDSTETHLGLREISVSGRQILLNGVPIFLRGYVDCCIFPLTGYPSWDIDHYRHQFAVAKSYGFNHVRLHSWTAPEPFWQAADECGMLVQTELPNWTPHYGFAENPPPEAVHHFLLEELEHIISELHLHPSWVMLSNGNELIYQAAGHPLLGELYERAKAIDPSRLYTDQTGMGQLPAPGRTVDFYIQSCNWHPPKKIYDAASNNTTQDFSAVTAYADRPVIGHEHGQFTMYVRPSEAEKYTGVIRPSWLESVQQTFAAKAMTARIDTYIQASGTHIVRTYIENIERARRTTGLGGIQLLDIRDFPGQGHATTGILDMFWDSKGLIEPEVFKQCNDAVVLLIRSPSRTVWNDDTLRVQIEVSNFSRAPLDSILTWELHTESQRLTGQLDVPATPTGDITQLGVLAVPLPPSDSAQEWVLTVQLGEARNQWHFWSFPYPVRRDNDRDIICKIDTLRNVLPTADYGDDFAGTGLDMHAAYKLNNAYQVAIADRLSLRLLQYLVDGGCVWLMPDITQLYDAVRTRYLPPFWSYLHFPENVSSVMGMHIPPHPALGRFPHDGCSNWQWYALVNDTPAICLDSVPFIDPIVEVIDNFNRAKRLCYAFETRVGQGRLLVSTWRLYDYAVAGLPEGRFLLNEILAYLRSDAFAPSSELSVGQLLGLIKLNNGLTFNME